MTTIACQFSDLSIQFGHRILFRGLSASLPVARHGLVAPNGQGKSLLLNILSHTLQPTTGAINWLRPFFPLRAASTAGNRVVDILGVAERYDALMRLEKGEASDSDFSLLEGAWQLPDQWRAAIKDAGVSIELADDVSQLSGGQLSRLRLCSAFMDTQQFILLDEPTNHLDHSGRRWLLQKLQQHGGGCVIASHDRALLRDMDCILELSANQLHIYGEHYDGYCTIKNRLLAAATHAVTHAEREVRKHKHLQQVALQRAASRRKQGEKLRTSGSQCRLLLDRQKNRAEQSLSRLKQKNAQQQMQLKQQLQDSRDNLFELDSQTMVLPNRPGHAGHAVLFSALQLPFVCHQSFSLVVSRGERWHISGDNGSGKSTLLKVVAGLLPPRAGECQLKASVVYLDQHFSLLDKSLSALQFLQCWNDSVSETLWRTRLANLRLDADKVHLPLAALSYGEQMKVALLAVSDAPQQPELLLLDEPENFLDLDSRLLLEKTLQSWQGTLMIVSHDEDFVSRLAVTHQLNMNFL